MREIEFRIYDKELEKMVYFDDEDYDYRPPLTFRLEQVFRKDNNYNDYEDFEWNDISDRVEVMQYTGLKDKNGKKIFEGDIAKYPYGNVVGKIIYLHGSFVLSDFYDENEWDLTVIVDDIEVIGNIWDNSELLKEG